MQLRSLIVVVFVLAALVGGVLLLATREGAAPQERVEKPLPAEQFLKNQ